MQIEVREQVLDIWRAVIARSFRDGKWNWNGRWGSNAISDAEQLLCIMYPATNVPALRFGRPDETPADVRAALGGLGSDLDAFRILIDLLLEYVERYRDENGEPSFPCGEYVEGPHGPSEAQLGLELVDSFSMSVTLMLSIIGFVKVLREAARGRSLLEKMAHLEHLASDRLTAAMAGLLRSFSVHVFDVTSEFAKNMCSMVNQSGEPDRIVMERLFRSLTDVRTRLKEEVTIGSGVVTEELDDPARLFECGWSWGVVKDAPMVEYGKAAGGQRPGVADDRPYLYFTVVAMDGIEDLFSPRTRILGLLDEEQQRLSQALQLRWDLCQTFWNTVATTSVGGWALEDLPWRTTDGVESDYFTLLMASMVVQRLVRERSDGTEVARLGRVFFELAQRARLTRRPLRGDPALDMHAPGFRLRLIGSEEYGEQQGWRVSSFASLLLKRVVTLIGLAEETAERERLVSLGDELWRHVLRRRLNGENLWDDPGGALPVDHVTDIDPSWYHTERVVECLVNSANVVKDPPRASIQLTGLAAEYLAEAEHLFDREKLNGTAQAGVQVRQSFQLISASIERARQLVRVQPGTSIVLTQQVLRDLESLAAARPQSYGNI